MRSASFAPSVQPTGFVIPWPDSSTTDQATVAIASAVGSARTRAARHEPIASGASARIGTKTASPVRGESIAKEPIIASRPMSSIVSWFIRSDGARRRRVRAGRGAGPRSRSRR